MPFNVQKAKEAGYSDAEIQAYLKTREQQQPQGEQKHAGALDRLLLSFGDAQGREQYLDKKGISEENVNKPGLDLGDITSKAGGLLPAGLGTAGFIGGAGLAGLLGLPSGPGAVATGAVGGALGGGAGEVAGERYRQALGEILGVRKNDNTKEDNEDLKSAALWGTATSALGPVLGKTGKAALGGTSRKAIQKALRPVAGTLAKYRKQNIDLLQEWANLGIKGNPSQIKAQASKIAEASRKSVDDLIEQSNISVSVDDAVRAVVDNAVEYGERASRTGNKAKTNALLDIAEAAERNLRSAAKNGKVSLESINNIKREFQSEIGEKFGSDAGVVEGQKKVQTALKNFIEKHIPQVKSGNRKTQIAQELIETINKLDDKGSKSLSDTIKGLSPAISGSLLGGVLGSSFGPMGGALGAIAGAGVGDVGKRAAISTASRTMRGQVLRQLEKVPGPDGVASKFILDLLR